MKSNLNRSINLTDQAPDLNNIKVIVGWRASQDFEIDLSVFLLENGRANDDSNFLYYNNKTSSDGAVKLLDANVNNAPVSISLDNIHKNSPEITQIAFLLTIHDAIARNQSFANVKHVYIKVADTSGRELFLHDFSEEYTNETAMVMAELHLKNNTWHIINQCFAGGLDAAMIKYGLM